MTDKFKDINQLLELWDTGYKVIETDEGEIMMVRSAHKTTTQEQTQSDIIEWFKKEV